eukprot:8508181-Lingulodinium_polyedra.AAC.1
MWFRVVGCAPGVGLEGGADLARASAKASRFLKVGAAPFQRFLVWSVASGQWPIGRSVQASREFSIASP